MIALTDCMFEELCLLLAVLLLCFYIYCRRTGTSVNTFINLEALFRRQLKVEKKPPPTPPNTPSKDYSKSPAYNSSVSATTEKSAKECVDTCPQIPCPQVDEGKSDQPVEDVEKAERKQICSGCPDTKPCPRRALEPSSDERSSLLSETNLEVLPETPKQKSALADGSRSKLPHSVSIQLENPSEGFSLANASPNEGDSGGEKGIEKVQSWQMAPPSQNVLFSPKFIESKSEEQPIPEESEEKPREIKAEETEEIEETLDRAEAPKLEEAKPEVREPEKTKPGECKEVVPMITLTTLDSACSSGICIPLPSCLLPHPKDKPKDQTCAESLPPVYIIIKSPFPCGCASGQVHKPPFEPVPAEPVPQPNESNCICSISPCPKEDTTEPSSVPEVRPKPTPEKPPTESIPTEKEPTSKPVSPEDIAVKPPCPDDESIDKPSPEDIGVKPPSSDNKLNEEPSPEDIGVKPPSSDNKLNEEPSPEDIGVKPPSSDNKLNEEPSPEDIGVKPPSSDNKLNEDPSSVPETPPKPTPEKPPTESIPTKKEPKPKPVSPEDMALKPRCPNDESGTPKPGSTGGICGEADFDDESETKEVPVEENSAEQEQEPPGTL